MQGSQHPCVAARPERVDVGENGCGRERKGQPKAGHQIRFALPQKIDSKQRENEQTSVPSVKRLGATAQAKTKESGHLNGECRGDGEAQGDERFRVSGFRGRRFMLRSEDQLLPQPFGVGACEFAGERIEAAHALDRYQESFIAFETSFSKRRQLVAKMSLEFLDIRTVNGLPPG